MDFNLAEGDQHVRLFEGAARGDMVELQLVYADTFDINGWGVTIDFNPNQLSYVSGSFQASSLIPGLAPLVDEGRVGKVGIGGRALGSDARNLAPIGALGTLSFFILPAFGGSTGLAISTVKLSVVGSAFNYANTSLGGGIVTIEGTVTALIAGDFDGNDAVDYDDFSCLSTTSAAPIPTSTWMATAGWTSTTSLPSSTILARSNDHVSSRRIDRRPDGSLPSP
jgi:hypothetical protein